MTRLALLRFLAVSVLILLHFQSVALAERFCCVFSFTDVVTHVLLRVGVGSSFCTEATTVQTRPRTMPISLLLLAVPFDVPFLTLPPTLPPKRLYHYRLPPDLTMRRFLASWTRLQLVD